MMWGKKKENGIWIAPASNWRLMFFGHDAFFIAAGRFRLRLMRPCAERTKREVNSKDGGE